MIRGKHIVIVVGILLLLLINYNIYNVFISATDDDLKYGTGLVGLYQFIVFGEVLIFIILSVVILSSNWNKIWNWEFNLNKWICKLKH